MIPGNDETLILDLIVPPELHIMQGIVKHLYENMHRKWPVVSKWLTKIGIEPRKYHGGAFLGNHCHEMLKHIDELRRIAPIEILEYVNVLDIFSKVVHSYFGMTLKIGYIDYIEMFTKAYMELDISVTLKVHMVMAHIADFCQKYGALGVFSEQAFESSHSDFKRNTWEKSNFKRSIGHPAYGEYLLRAAVVYNSTHI